MAIEVTIRKWGNSLGVVFPRELVDKNHFKVGDKIAINPRKKSDLHNIFGSLPRKISGQEMKDLARKGWKK